MNFVVSSMIRAKPMPKPKLHRCEYLASEGRPLRYVERSKLQALRDK
jgi:hypothetical protein